MRILIIGAEQLGYFLSKSLMGSGHKVTIIDSDPVRCEQIANTFDVTTFCGDGTRVETLAAAGAGKCDVLIAVTNRDEDNLIACELGKRQFGIDRTIAQSNNSKNIRLMKRLGVDIVMDASQIITDLIEHEIEGSSDASITGVVPNDLSPIFAAADIRQVFCNGRKSHEMYRRYLEPVYGRTAICLPSTSPANAAWSLERLSAAWAEHIGPWL